jgi:peptide chain release factor 1
MEDRLEEIERRYDEIAGQMAAPEVASDPSRLRELGRTFAELEEIVLPYRKYKQTVQEAEDFDEFARHEVDAQAAENYRKESDRLRAEAADIRGELELLLVPKDPNDDKDVVVEIRAGAGGQEAALWAGELLEMYRRYAERRRYKTEVLSASPSDLGGFKEVVVEIRGKGAYSRLKHEAGPHRVQRVPETESQGRIHTSTATVAVLPEADDVDVEIRPEDIEVDVFRSSGPGGQSVNTTDSAVRITHKPTGIVVSVQEERSQLQNKEKAMRYLRSRLLKDAQDRQHEEQAATRREQVGTGERAEKIRTYNFPQNRVTDHRVRMDRRLQDVVAGDLDPIIDELLAEERRRQLGAGGDGSAD